MNKLYLNIGAFLLFALFSLPLYAQNGIIQGHVISAGNEPIEMVYVTIKGSTKGSLTDSLGRFEFSDVKPGIYRLDFSYMGKQKHLSDVAVELNDVTNVNMMFEQSSVELDEAMVVGKQTNKYANKKSEYVARLPLRNIENPQVYNVINKELLNEQLISNVDDAIKNTPGIYTLWSSTGRGGDGSSYYALRGFSVQPTMINGMAGQTNGGLDAANIERIEVIKGPSGTLFGSSLISFGGLINVVTKQPFETTSNEVSFLMGSYGLNRITADINTPLNDSKTLLFRVNGSYQYQNSYQDAGFMRSFFVAPSLQYIANDRLKFTFNTEFYTAETTNALMVFLNRSRTLFYTTPEELGINYKRSFTSNDITMKTPTVRLYGQADYKMSDKWTSQTSVSQSTRQSNGLYQYVMFLDANNDDTLSRYVGSQASTGLNYDIQQNFIGDFHIGSMRNRMVIGADVFMKQDNIDQCYILFDKVASSGASTTYSTLNADAVNAKIANGTPTKNKNTSYTYSAYISEVLDVTDRLLLMASLRFDRFEYGDVYAPATNKTTDGYGQNYLSPKFGAVYQVWKDKVAVFGNYMNGFKNIGPTAQPDGTVSNFDPQRANQWEAGVKMSAFNNKLSGTLSYYDIKVTNVTRPDPDKPAGFTIQDGDIYSRGFEADIVANPLEGLNIIAGYSYNDSKNEKTDPGTIGRRPTSAGPQHLVNFWASYTFTKTALRGFGLGFGGNYAGENMITNSAATGVFTLPAYTMLNAVASYNYKSFKFSLKVNNLTNIEYYNGWSTVNPQMLRQVMGSVSFSF